MKTCYEKKYQQQQEEEKRRRRNMHLGDTMEEAEKVGKRRRGSGRRR